MLAQPAPHLLIPPLPSTQRETSPSSSLALGRLCLFTPGPTSADGSAVAEHATGMGTGMGGEGPLLTTVPIPDRRSRFGAGLSTSGSPSVSSFDNPYQGVKPPLTAGQDQRDTFVPRPTPAMTTGKQLRRPRSSNGLAVGTSTGTRTSEGRFHPFLPVRSRGSSTAGNLGPPVDLLIAPGTSSQAKGLSLDTSLTIPRTYLASHGHGSSNTFSLNFDGPVDCPSASGTGVSSEEESICSPQDDVPSGLPLTIVDAPDAGVMGIGAREAWGRELPRTWGRSLSGSSTGSAGSDGGEAGTGKKKNARGLRIDVRRTFSVGGNVRDDKNKETYVEPVLTKGIKYATVGRRPMLSISLDPLSPVKPRRATTSRSLFPLPRANHLDPEGHARPPYADGPVEVVSGVWIGNEESVTRYVDWVGQAGRAMIVNVAKELDDPFEARLPAGYGEAGPVIRKHEATADRPGLNYLKLDWTHGETDLASESNDAGIPKRWGFERTITAMEEARRAGTPILIHCQCGISRSATLVIAYVLWLAHHGYIQETGLGRNSTMWEVNDHVKGKSEWVGPNVSLICQLLEWEKVLRQTASSTTATSQAGEQPDTTFAKREAEELDEQMKARSSKRRKSEPDCGLIGSDQ